MTTSVPFSQAVDSVKSALDIVAVVSASVSLRKAGRHYTGLCPFHKEKTPSFSVSREKNLFKCFGCGEAGDAITFLMKTRNRPFADVIREEAERLGLSIADSQDPKRSPQEQDRLLTLMQAAAQWFAAQMTPDVIGYLANRGYHSDAIRRFGLGYAPDSWEGLRKHLGQQYPEVTDHQLAEAGLVIQREDRPGAYDRFRGRLMIPIHHDHGQVVAFGGRGLAADSLPKYLNSPETPAYVKSRILYGLNWAKDTIKANRRAIVMEGYFDVMRAHLSGFTEAVATCGTALTREHVTLLLRHGADTLYLAFDSDAAGQRAILSALDVLDGIPNASDLKIKVVQLPAGKDPDEFLATQPPEAFEQVLAQAITHWQFRCEAALQGLDLEQIDDRMKATNQLVATLQKLKHPVLRSEYARKYAPLLGITDELILNYINDNKSKRSLSKNSSSSRKISDIHTYQLKNSKSLIPKYKKAEYAFFYSFLYKKDFFCKLKAEVSNLSFLTEGAIKMAQCASWPRSNELDDVLKEIKRDIYSDNDLRIFYFDVISSEDIIPSFSTIQSLLKLVEVSFKEEHKNRYLKLALHGMYDLRYLETSTGGEKYYEVTNKLKPIPDPLDKDHGYSHPLEAQYAFKAALDEKIAILKEHTENED